ncbi:uncharacterized protein G2W53_014183 [Senna tora]|uniref:Uncharacterized protein n=1 Tax=Senna tora TaxID=362788 RepID=A0A834WT14_9FABA|nr:uncharacterized protein G2W53_014183 [Senna tora]
MELTEKTPMRECEFNFDDDGRAREQWLARGGSQWCFTSVDGRVDGVLQFCTMSGVVVDVVRRWRSRAPK